MLLMRLVCVSSVRQQPEFSHSARHGTTQIERKSTVPFGSNGRGEEPLDRIAHEPPCS